MIEPTEMLPDAETVQRTLVAALVGYPLTIAWVLVMAVAATISWVA